MTERIFYSSTEERELLHLAVFPGGLLHQVDPQNDRNDDRVVFFPVLQEFPVQWEISLSIRTDLHAEETLKAAIEADRDHLEGGILLDYENSSEFCDIDHEAGGILVIRIKNRPGKNQRK